MIYLHKILPVFLSPIVIVLFFLIIALITTKRRWVIVAISFLYIMSTPLVADALFRQIEGQSGRLSPSEAPEADAIVVLSAGMRWVKTNSGLIAEWPSPSRFFGGIELLDAGRAPLLVFTGGKLPWQKGDETEGLVLKRHAELMQIDPQKILLSEQVENTEQEALSVRKVLPFAKNKIILVTSAFHMQRARALFERQGFDVFPYPVNARESAENITVMKFLPDPRALVATHTAMHEMLGRLFYFLKNL
jgi:uncharacterized SAM-binding protein YcdF (DUF218 family)